MARAIVDPGELRRFAQGLRRFNGEMSRHLQAMQSQLSNLGATWRDQEHQKFVEEFQQQMHTLAGFMENTDEYARFLLRKAERTEDYLNQR